MLRYFRNRHIEGEVVVHCTDGLRRTSVVLMALLVMESILSTGCLRVKEALTKLRKCRPGMVSNQEDFNLALEIADELLHGAATAWGADEFKGNLSKTSSLLFRKAHVLESVSVSEAVQRPAFLDMHRFPSIIPLDTRRVVLQSEDQIDDEGDKEEHDRKSLKDENQDSREDKRLPSNSYINAVWVDSYDRRFGFVVTEHPLAEMRERFWRLVVQNRCQNVVFCNDYTKVDQEFPNILPGEGGEMNFGKYLVQVLAVQAPAKHIIKYQVNITLCQLRDAPLMVSVYKITGWPYGQELPESSRVVGDVAELLCESFSAPDRGPSLLCCGDGVTASGLLAGAVCVVQRLRDSREVDIYRTVVKLKRCRHEFITSSKQFEFLYFVAARYIDATMIYEGEQEGDLRGKSLTEKR
ncbi:receptor-type tyrosine-protein phosphatase kappa-like [Penaeus chinensis]|uniref:receptor-type tyrosine-protein phosphatase kappa-like n=1 Tax=Penaeus chinensis TaxID=139456 RepID=UPI001FB8073D|nr:receptor-type tyrosine-protein phosphatase kappa-like [Penaeus chinensis]